jgi:tetratricopeptide (TPR) repeat protein
MSLAAIVVAGAIGAARPAGGQSDPEIVALNQQVISLYQAKRFAEGLPLARRYADAARRLHGDSHPQYAEALNLLAVYLLTLGSPSEAEPSLRRAVAVFEHSARGKAHAGYPSSLNSLSALLRETGRFAEAEPLIRKGLAIAEARYGPESHDVASLLNNRNHSAVGADSEMIAPDKGLAITLSGWRVSWPPRIRCDFATLVTMQQLVPGWVSFDRRPPPWPLRDCPDKRTCLTTV